MSGALQLKYAGAHFPVSQPIKLPLSTYTLDQKSSHSPSEELVVHALLRRHVAMLDKERAPRRFTLDSNSVHFHRPKNPQGTMVLQMALIPYIRTDEGRLFAARRLASPVQVHCTGRNFSVTNKANATPSAHMSMLIRADSILAWDSSISRCASSLDSKRLM